jgi:hypothetical protein
MMVAVAFAVVALFITGFMDGARDPAPIQEGTQHAPN